MEKIDLDAPYPVTGDILKLLLLATTRTTHKDLRKQFLKSVDDWLDQFDEAADTKVASGECKTALRNTTGTLLEPMIVEPWDIEIAARLARLTFQFGGMGTGSDEAILIGSRDAIGGGGGVYIKKSNPPIYLERFPFGRETPANQRTWCFSPQYEHAAFEETQSCDFNFPVAKAVWSEGSLRVPLNGNGSLNWLHFDPETLADDLKSHSTIGADAEGFGRFGLVVDVDDDNVVILPERPESMLRLSALMAQDAVLFLDPEGSPHGHRSALCVQLSEPTDDGFEFPAAVHSRDNALSHWIRLPLLKTYPDIDRELCNVLLEDLHSLENRSERLK
jgi:hypothetical protein